MQQTVLEAMSHGLPVIAINHHGVGEIVTDETGIRIEPVSYDYVKKGFVRTIQPPIPFRKFLPHPLYSVRVCTYIPASSAGGGYAQGIASAHIQESGSGVFPVFRCFIRRG